MKWMVSARAQRLVLGGIDTAAIAGSALVALAVSGAMPFNTTEKASWGILTAIAAIAWITSLAVFDAYNPRHIRAGVIEYKRLLLASFSVAGLVGVTCYLLDLRYPPTIFMVWFALGTITMVIARFVRRNAMHRLHRKGMLRTPVLIAGSTQHVDEVARVLRRESWLGYEVIGAATHRKHDNITGTGLPVLGTIDGVREIVGEHEVEAVIFAEGSFDSPAEFRRIAWKLEDQDVHMIVVPTLTDVGSHRLDVRPMAGLPLVDVERPRAIAAGRWIKRAFDIAVSSVLLLLASPFLALTALAIKLEDGGPVVFRQRRVGIKGEEFDCLKFRSMCVDAEDRLAALMEKNEGAGVLFKMTDDPRITKVGKFIRRFSIDELPQLWNAFRGDMSLVGPRPALPREVAQYESDTMRRLDVRPGLTGLWQVSGRSNLSWEDTVRLDLYYVDNWSMTQDLMILAKTAKAVVGSDGAY
ncbi:MAG: sugar transferase [Propioniciclava sp.]|uniref:sugar transferase n=1 Tax=Propioniciclava sp. TaxID=2038686 RepID=UPI0039E2A39E